MCTTGTVAEAGIEATQDVIGVPQQNIMYK